MVSFEVEWLFLKFVVDLTSKVNYLAPNNLSTGPSGVHQFLKQNPFCPFPPGFSLMSI